ncbi:transcription factor HES-5-like [Periophthalmus magnuspinnatus]|uniref:Transcription factor HES-5 n=1 Tax=Periophthalmus magnuspinnatus TaxID=409849 RepID=A0A3B3ZYE3_9GOBI|nr:transcription factor HES-5-like [Periophthalmus magnuspinnatus]
MAPTITAAMGPSQEYLSVSHKLRKPVVEKLRRERINSSIEQLKSLLCAEFLQQQPDSKLEKADILEMAVIVLTRLQQQNGAVGQGYSRCAQEMTHFMSKENLNSQSQGLLLLSSTERTLSTVHSCSKDRSQERSVIWRPW